MSKARGLTLVAHKSSDVLNLPPELAFKTKKSVNPASMGPATGSTVTSTSETVTVKGAVKGDPVTVGFSEAMTAGVLLFGEVSAADTVKVHFVNTTTGTVDLASGTLKVIVWKF